MMTSADFPVCTQHITNQLTGAPAYIPLMAAPVRSLPVRIIPLNVIGPATLVYGEIAIRIHPTALGIPDRSSIFFRPIRSDTTPQNRELRNPLPETKTCIVRTSHI